MVGHSWVVVVVMAVIRRKPEFVNVNALHDWVVIVITTVIFTVVFYRRFHGLAMAIVMVVITHYG